MQRNYGRDHRHVQTEIQGEDPLNDYLADSPPPEIPVFVKMIELNRIQSGEPREMAVVHQS